MQHKRLSVLTFPFTHILLSIFALLEMITSTQYLTSNYPHVIHSKLKTLLLHKSYSDYLCQSYLIAFAVSIQNTMRLGISWFLQLRLLGAIQISRLLSRLTDSFGSWSETDFNLPSPAQPSPTYQFGFD